MGTNTKVNYENEKGAYYKVLFALLVFTAITFAQPFTFLTDHNFGMQLLIGLVKAVIILLYYMHLKGEKLIGWTVIFAVFLVAFFFVTVVIDVDNFQYKDMSHITSQAHIDVDYHSTSHEE